MVPNLSNRSPPRNIEVEDILPSSTSRYKSNAMAETTLSLESLSFGELEGVIVDRLHERRSIGPPVDLRAEESHIEWLIDQFRQGSTGLRDRMSAALRTLLTKKCQGWDPAARANLLDVLQESGEQLTDEILAAVRTRSLLDPCGPEAHAGLLKCLISLNRRLSPDFWLDQLELLGPEYGALIMSGLVQHGLSMGMHFLPRLSEHETAAREIRLALPVLDDIFGRQNVERELQRYLPDCLESAREILRIATGDP
jgi:hypothetical protein